MLFLAVAYLTRYYKNIRIWIMIISCIIPFIALLVMSILPDSPEYKWIKWGMFDITVVFSLALFLGWSLGTSNGDDWKSPLFLLSPPPCLALLLQLQGRILIRESTTNICPSDIQHCWRNKANSGILPYPHCLLYWQHGRSPGLSNQGCTPLSRRHDRVFGMFRAPDFGDYLLATVVHV